MFQRSPVAVIKASLKVAQNPKTIRLKQVKFPQRPNTPKIKWTKRKNQKKALREAKKNPTM